MNQESQSQLPPIDEAKFLALSDWGTSAFRQLKERVEVKIGDGDQAIIEQAINSFSQNVAYSGVVAAYDRAQKPSTGIDSGPLATKFDILLFYFDQTGELLTDAAARREVQGVIVNLCGGKNRYKFLYEQAADNYEVADIVKAAVEFWGRTQSKEAKLNSAADLLEKQRQLNQAAVGAAAAAETPQPVTREWGEAQRQKVEEISARLSKKVNAELLRYLKRIDPVKIAGQTEMPDNVAETDKQLHQKFDNLEGVDLRKLLDLGMDNETDAHLGKILQLKVAEKREEQREQIEKNKQKQEVRNYFARHGLKLEFDRMSRVDEELQKFFDAAIRLGIEPLPSQVALKISSARGDISEVELVFEDTGKISQTLLTSKRLAQAPDSTARGAFLTIWALEETNFDVKLVRSVTNGKEKFNLLLIEENIGQVEIDAQGRLAVEWRLANPKEVLEGSVAVANLWNKLWGEGERLGEEELGGLRLRAEAKSQPEETPFEKAAPAPEPPESIQREDEIPDWLKELRQGSSTPPPAEEEEESGGAEPVELLAAVPAARREPEPEAPKPIAVTTLTEISEAIKAGNGVAEVTLAPTLIKNIVRQTMDSIIQARFKKFNPSISVEIKVNSGLVLEGEINAKWGIMPVRIPVALTLNNRFGLISFDFQSKLGDRNEVERELRGVLNQLNNTFRAELAKYNISSANMEGAEIMGEQTYAKFRGEVINR